MDEAIFHKTIGGDQKRNQQCRKAMKSLFTNTLSLATSAGWTEAEASLFIAEVADDHLLKLHRSKETKDRANDYQPF